MKIEIIKDWYDDGVHIKIDGNETGSIYSESVDLVAEVITKVVNTVASITPQEFEIIVREL